MSAPLTWHVENATGELAAKVADRLVGRVCRVAKSGETTSWLAFAQVPDLRFRRNFETAEAAAEWLDSEWREFVALIVNLAVAPPGAVAVRDDGDWL
ncbi:hypothetical protein [Hydrocarboniphaga sp.]|uniref:hypothetical protein n=1 Tax=Hydrocarboniphaga sp. TaxID=2033016 RepID=UPI003D14A416